MNLKPLSSKAHFLLSPFRYAPFPNSIIVSTTPSCSHSQSHYRRQHEEISKNVRVSVWWDFENCNLPADVNVFKVAHAITTAIRANGIKGPIQITAFGDVQQLSRSKQEALSSTGINLTHIPNEGKNSADRSLLVDLMYWVSQNPPPAHLFLISGDGDFASALHRLRMNNYNILLASNKAPTVLCSAASIMWRWNALVRGENLTGKIFNQPPDGPYGSWYGNYKMPLEDPFSVVEQPTYLQGEKFTEASSETKVRPIPKAVKKQIINILSLYPKGISIMGLRNELRKTKLALGNDFYGYKKFSSFLFSMQNVLNLQRTSDGHFLVRGTVAKPEPAEPNPCLSTVIVDDNQQSSWPLKPNAEGLVISESVDRNSVMPSSPELSTRGPTREMQQSPIVEKAVKVDIEQPPKESPIVEKAVKMDIERPPKEIEESPSIGKEVLEVTYDKVAEDNLMSVKEKDSKCEVGFFKKIWRRWFGSNDDSSQIKGNDRPKNSHSSGDNSAKNSENPELITKGPTEKVRQSPLIPEGVKMDIEQPPKELVGSPSIGKVVEVTNDMEAEDDLLSVKQQDSKCEVGFFMKIWRRRCRSDDDSSEIKGHDFSKNSHAGDNSAKNSESTLEKFGTLGKSLEKKEADKQIVKTSIQENVQVPTLCSSFNSESTLGKETCLNSESCSEKSGEGPGLRNPIMTSCELGRHTPDSKSSVDQSSGELKHMTGYSERHQIFSEDSFWRDMKSSLDSLRGSLLVSQSRTREEMARNLQKEGLVVLRSLDETDVLSLVDMLISEKKWVEEYPSEASPFKLTLSVGKSTSKIDPQSSNRLSSIFSATPLQSDSKRQPEHGRAGRSQNSHDGVSQSVSCKSRPSESSRRDTLINCQMLVNEISKDFPKGYDIDFFKKLFLERYGYHLNIEKLESLLQTLAGVKIESARIIPSDKVGKCSIQDSTAPNIKESNVVHISDTSKDDESDSIWEELGPVENIGSRTKEAEEKCTFPQYESSSNDVDFPNSEGEPSAVAQLVEKSKAGFNSEDSSLLEVLNSWSVNIESDNRKDKLENLLGMLQPSDTSELGTKIDTPSGKHGRKKRPQRSYSFVAESAGSSPKAN